MNRESEVFAVPGDLSNVTEIDCQLLHEVKMCLECLSNKKCPRPEWSGAWAWFERTFAPLLRRFAVACHVKPDEIDDCLQEVWIELIQTLPAFQFDGQHGRFCCWLYKIVHGKASDIVAKRRRQPTTRLVHQVEARLASHQAGPAEIYEQHRQHEMVHRVFSYLRRKVSRSSYSVFRMRWLEQQTIAEIAEAKHLTSHQVRSRLDFVKQRFIRLLVDAAEQNFSSKL